MARRVKSDGYIVRQALNDLDRSNVELTQVLERLLECESAQVRSVLVARGALVMSKRSDAVRTLRAVLIEDGHE
jgi:Mg2+/Co2+ transporter CorC